MSRDAEDDDHTTFLRIEGTAGPDGQDAVLSRAAYQLHAFAIRNSFQDGHPGFASDEYLGAISAETSITATELCTAGVWVRVQGGYEILDDEMIEQFFRTTIRGRRMRQCEDELGGCRTDADEPTLCEHCGCLLDVG